MDNDYGTRLGNGVEFYGQASNCLVHYCTFDNIYDAAVTAQGFGGVDFDNIVFAYNVISNSEYSFEYIQKVSGTTNGLHFVNNTCYNAGGGFGHGQRWDYDLGCHLRLSNNIGTMTNIIIKNNIFYNATEAGIIPYYANIKADAYDIDNNLYYVITVASVYDSGFSMDDYVNLSAWNTYSDMDDNSASSDPLFKNGFTDLSLQPGSPAINAGVDVGLTIDYLGNSIVGLPDIGAYEFNGSTSDTEKPSITGFTIPPISTSQSVSISSFTAIDNIGVIGYLLSETLTTPSAGASGWLSDKPSSYTFSTEGTKTLYAWVKDAAGNVSSRVSDQVVITLPDVTKPVITSFAIPATSSSLVVPISSYTATDNKSVTGFKITESSTAPNAGDAGWITGAPTSYFFTAEGTKTLYAWVKDEAGNVSASLNANVTISSPVASNFTFTGPSSGNVNSASDNFTVTPNNPYTGTITLTPSGTGSAGISAKVLTFSNSSAAQTFNITPTVAGNITLTPSNSGSIKNPGNLIYNANAVLPDAPTSPVATAGNTTATVTFTAPANNGGSVITGYTVTSAPAGGIDSNAGSTSLSHTITGLTNGTSYTFTVKAMNSAGTSVASAPSNPVIPTPKKKTEYKSICQGEDYLGWTEPGEYQRTLALPTGGDSIVTTILTVNPSYDVSEDITILEGESYQGWTTSGEYERTLTSVTGCDSIVTTNLTVSLNQYTTEDIAICEGSSYEGWTTTGQYQRILTAASGADSIVTTNLTVNPVYHVSEDINILEGESYKGWTTSGEYERTLTSVTGCDSIVTTHLTVSLNKYTTEDITICEGSSYKGWTTTGQYQRILTAASGADSIVTTNLTVNPVFHVSEDITYWKGKLPGLVNIRRI